MYESILKVIPEINSCQGCFYYSVIDSKCISDVKGISIKCAKDKTIYIIDHSIKSNDPINPNHYKNGEIECIDAIKAATVNKKGIQAACTANVIKYLWRYESKNGLQDVEKAKWYLERLIKELCQK
jgi:hypothetical protein